jgi:hypothetical protein
VQSFLQAAEINKVLAAGGTGTYCYCTVRARKCKWVLTTSSFSTNGKADLREDIPLFTKLLACDSKSGNSETVDDWKNGCML